MIKAWDTNTDVHSCYSCTLQHPSPQATRKSFVRRHQWISECSWRTTAERMDIGSWRQCGGDGKGLKPSDKFQDKRWYDSILVQIILPKSYCSVSPRVPQLWRESIWMISEILSRSQILEILYFILFSLLMFSFEDLTYALHLPTCTPDYERIFSYVHLLLGYCGKRTTENYRTVSVRCKPCFSGYYDITSVLNNYMMSAIDILFSHYNTKELKFATILPISPSKL